MQSSAPALVIISGAPASGKTTLAGAYAMLYLVAQRLLEARTGLILESNFRRGVSETELRPLLVWGDPALIHCTAAPEIVQARYAARHERGDRHPAHLDADRATALADKLAAGHFDPLDLLIPTLVVDTTDGWHPAYEDIRDFAAFPRASLAR